MTDIMSREKRSALMSKIRSTDTKMEVRFRKLLWGRGLRFRKNYKMTGKPDIVFSRHKIAVFLDGDFWHGYNWKKARKGVKSGKKFWIPKIESNIRRDAEVNKRLRGEGWTVLRFWEHQIEGDVEKCAARVMNAVKAREKAAK